MRSSGSGSGSWWWYYFWLVGGGGQESREVAQPGMDAVPGQAVRWGPADS